MPEQAAATFMQRWPGQPSPAQTAFDTDRRGISSRPPARPQRSPRRRGGGLWMLAIPHWLGCRTSRRKQWAQEEVVSCILNAVAVEVFPPAPAQVAGIAR